MANPFFDAAYYLAKNPDVLAAGYTLATAEQHYIKYGAAESVTGVGRAPNAWFDARAYLIAYPDLVANGVTAANAFYHYITYGINEGRSPSQNLNPATFSYADYAASNADLRTAFGITDTTHLTADQQHKLLGHFLAYGIHESRAGAESIDGTGFFAQFDIRPPVSSPPPAPVPPIVIDGTHVNHIYNGTPGDDVFTSTLTNLDGAIINGMAGHDTLKVTNNTSFQSTFTANDVEDMQFDGNAALALVTVNGSGVNSLSLSGTSGFTWTGPNPHILNFNADNLNVRLNVTDAGGIADHITVNTKNGQFGSLYLNGIEQVDMVMEDHSAASVLLGQLSPGATTGTVNLTGSTSDFSLTFRILSALSPNLTDGVVNGSLATGNLTISQNNGPADYNVTITSGSGNDTLSTLVDSSHTATLNGGSGDDILIGSAGLDILTGGAGNDIFRFGPGTASPINLSTGIVDTISDLASGDTIEFAGAAVPGSNYDGWGASLASAAAAVEANIHTANVNAIVVVGTQGYFMNTGDGTTPGAIIKLVLADGTAFTGQMEADLHGAHFVN